MANLLFDVTRLLARGMKGHLPSGIDRVDLAYLKHYGPHSRAVLQVAGTPIVLSTKASRRLFDQLTAFGSNRLAKIVHVLLASASSFTGVQRGAVYLNTSHSGLLRDRLARTLTQQDVRLVWMVHDLIPVEYPEYCRAGEAERHDVRMENAVRHAHALVTNSKATLKALQRFSRSRGLTLPETRVASLAPALPRGASAPPPLAAPYFLVIGTIEPRKNLAMLLHVWQRLASLHTGMTPRLVIAGRRGWECENVIDLLERSPALRQNVVELPSCRDEELARWLAHARALLFPSFAEGYGLPLVEALNLGTPVIASDLPVFHETAGAVPEYLDPLDGRDWLEMVERYTAPISPAREEQLQRLSSFRAPSWNRHFAVVDELIGEIARAVPGRCTVQRA